MIIDRDNVAVNTILSYKKSTHLIILEIGCGDGRTPVNCTQEVHAWLRDFYSQKYAPYRGKQFDTLLGVKDLAAPLLISDTLLLSQLTLWM